MTELYTLSKASDSEFCATTPSGLALYPFQRAGVEYLTRVRKGFLADEMGLGKTPQAIAAFNTIGIDKYLVICPASLCANWKREVERWTTTRYPPHVFSSKPCPKRCVLIVSYGVTSSMETMRRIMRAYRFDGVIFDECHFLKNPEAIRSRVLFAKNGPFDRASAIFALSGTPIVNRPMDVFNVLMRMRPDVLGDMTENDFGNEYCVKEWNRFAKRFVFTGAKNAEALGYKLRSTCLIRRLKKDVLAQLPPKIRRIIPLQTSESVAQTVARERDLFETAEQRALTEDERNEVFRVRVQLALWKVPIAEEYIRDLLLTTPKVLVFGWHREAMARLCGRLAELRPVVLTGATPDKERQQRVDLFQNDPSRRVFIGSIAAAGIGLTLTAAHHVVMIEASWRPGDNEQAEDRAHRITQQKTVVIDYLVYQKSVDERVLDVSNRKTKVIEKIFNS